VFCPNCGTKNDDTATSCTKCGFKLSGASAAKFRGTMMLNTDQSVQEMVDEHRRKLAEGSSGQELATEPPTPAPSASPPPGSVPGAAKLQPPRAGLPKRRMGTMLGVAPQVGGVQPPATPTPPPPSPVPAPPESSPRSAPDPLGGTIAFAAVAPAAARAAQPMTAGRTEAFAAVPPAESATPGHHPLTAGRTEAFEALPTPAPAPAAHPLAAGRTEAFAAEPAATAQPARALAGRTEAFTAPRSEHEPASASAASTPTRADRDSLAPAAGLPQRLRPLDVFLIVITCGLYALVIWARQRKS
jgi:hypothetical protein